jgi:hypothetical protein
LGVHAFILAGFFPFVTPSHGQTVDSYPSFFRAKSWS